MPQAVNPYVDWLELPPSKTRPTYYELLGVAESEDNERTIKGAYYRRVARVSVYQNGANADTCKKMLAELAEARDCLIDPEAKRKYNLGLKPKPAATDQDDSDWPTPTTITTTPGKATPGKATAEKATAEKAKPATATFADSPKVGVSGFGHSDNRRSDVGHARTTVHVGKSSESKFAIESQHARSPFDMLSVMRTPQEILSEIVETRGLTSYQAKEFMEGDPHHLVLGPYLIENELMRGSWGQVFTATRISTGELVSLRVLPPTFKSELALIKNQIRQASRLPAERFQRPIECAEKDRIYLASQYVPGEDLKSMVDRRGGLQTAQAVYAAARIVEHLAVAQKAKLLHLELRPSKILINRAGGVFIRDLALANAISQQKRYQSNPGRLAQVLPREHLQYLAPEVFLSESIPSFQSDIYSIGCILYYLLTGRPVFQNEDSFRIVLAHREAAVPSLMEFDSTIPDRLDQCVRRMLAKKPGNRFSSYGQLHQNLKLIYQELGVSSVSSNVLWKDVQEAVSADAAAKPKIRRFHRGRAAVLAASVSLVVAGGTFGLNKVMAQPESEPQPIDQAAAPAPQKPVEPKILRSFDNEVPEVESVDSFQIR